MKDVPKPSDIVLAFPPLTGTLGRSEREHAAACIVRYCQINGDRWQSVVPTNIGEMLRDEAENKPVKDWVTNPFFRPDVLDLVKFGYASLDEATRAVELTEEGIEALGPWTRKDRGEDDERTGA